MGAGAGRRGRGAQGAEQAKGPAIAMPCPRDVSKIRILWKLRYCTRLLTPV
jgi:hypothetical protein